MDQFTEGRDRCVNVIGFGIKRSPATKYPKVELQFLEKKSKGKWRELDGNSAEK
jgi:hypothetical protein